MNTIIFWTIIVPFFLPLIPWLFMLPKRPLFVFLKKMPFGLDGFALGWMPIYLIVCPKSQRSTFSTLNHEYQHWLDVRALTPWGAAFAMAFDIVRLWVTRKNHQGSFKQILLRKNVIEDRAYSKMYEPRVIKGFVMESGAWWPKYRVFEPG